MDSARSVSRKPRTPGTPAEKAENLEREPAGFGNETRTTRDRAYVSSAAEEDDDARRETFRSFRVSENVSADRWLRGPVDPAGALVHVSDRPLTCASAAPAGDGVAVGGTDHAVRVVGVAKEDAAAKNRRRDAPAAFFFRRDAARRARGVGDVRDARRDKRARRERRDGLVRVRVGASTHVPER